MLEFGFGGSPEDLFNVRRGKEGHRRRKKRLVIVSAGCGDGFGLTTSQYQIDRKNDREREEEHNIAVSEFRVDRERLSSMGEAEKEVDIRSVNFSNGGQLKNHQHGSGPVHAHPSKVRTRINEFFILFRQIGLMVMDITILSTGSDLPVLCITLSTSIARRREMVLLDGRWGLWMKVIRGTTTPCISHQMEINH